MASFSLCGTDPDHDGLGGALFPGEQDGLALLHDGLHQEVRPHVVHIGHQDGGVVRHAVCGVQVLRDLEMWRNPIEATSVQASLVLGLEGTLTIEVHIGRD